jgi:NAD(P)-dependent dehydrogenase (short-subunit alcohol dehydrogenase family)
MLDTVTTVADGPADLTPAAARFCVIAATALITGGTGGLGAAVTRGFLDAGWRVVVPIHAERERDRVPVHERLLLEPADLSDPASAAAVAQLAGSDAAAPLRAVANLVGGFAEGGRVHETPIEDFEAQLRVNLRPTYLVCQAAIPYMLAAGGGAIVCVASRAALRPFSGAAGYVTAKAAVLAFVDALAVEYRNDAIRANAILPSVIDTPANRAAMPDADVTRWVRPEEIADVIRYLCEDGSRPISGAHVPVYGRA